MFKFCIKYIKKYSFKFYIYISINIALGILGIASPIIYGNFLDNIIYKKNMTIFFVFVILSLILSVFNMIITYLSSMIRINIESKSGFSLCVDVLKHLNTTSLLDLENENSSYLSQRIKNDSRDIISFCLGIVASIILNLVGLTISLVLIIKFDYKLIILVFVISILHFIGYKIFKSPLYRASEQVREQQSRHFSNINNQISHAKFIKSHSVEEMFFSVLDKSFTSLLKKIISSQKLTYLYNSYNSLLSIISRTILLIIGGINIINGNITIGTFTILSSYLDRAMSSSMFFASLGESYQANLSAYNRIRELLNKPCVINNGGRLNEINNINLENINFKYNEKLIINNFSYEFNKGYIYWIKGDNGAGKSTIISLIIGLYEDKYEGNIYYNNKDIKSLEMYDIRKNLIGIVEQNPILFEDSIMNNITFCNNYDFELLNKYIKLVGLDKFLNSDKNKFDQIINENSTNISGGEKQKLSILRELIKNPSLLVFDEPTSSMDKDSKIEFYKYLQELKTEKIIIIISHDQAMKEIYDFTIEMESMQNNIEEVK